MGVELQALFVVTVAYVATVLTASVLTVSRAGVDYAMSNRDAQPEMTSAAARAKRAAANHLEGLAFFAPFALILAQLDAGSSSTATAAWAYAATRIAHAPLYVIGFGTARSIVWVLGFVALTAFAAMTASALFS